MFFEKCKEELPVDRSCQTVRLTQFLLPGCFDRPDAATLPEGYHAILPPQILTRTTGSQSDPADVERDVQRRFDRVKKQLPTTRALAEGRLPDPRSHERDVDGMRKALTSADPKLCVAEIPDEKLYERYLAHIETVQGREIRRVGNALHRAGFLHAPIQTESDLLEAVKAVNYPDAVQPLSTRFPLVAFCAIWEQSWCPRGYARGELINSISLAPGEELTLEMHTWTKETFKSERELAVESEVTLTNNVTARDHLEVVGKLATQSSFGANSNVNITIPIEGIPLGIGGGLDAETVLNTALDTTVQRTTESTTEAASALRSERKLRIEVARETGREEKQLRKVANANRCHTLNVHYFEVLSQYEVRTELVDIVPCVLLETPIDPITVDWVLCHEHILKRGLLSRLFLQGFEAAKALATHEKLEEANEESALQTDPLPPIPSTSPIELEMRNHRDAITRAYTTLVDTLSENETSRGALLQAVVELDLVSMGAAVADLLEDLPKLLALGILRLNPTATNALDGLVSPGTGVSGLESVRNFFSSVTPRDFKHINPMGTAAGKALDAIGIPSEVSDLLLWTWPEILDIVRDDCGLYVAVKAAHRRLSELQPAVVGPDVGRRAAAEFESEASKLLDPPRSISRAQLAGAEVEFDRLRCHIEEHRIHYFQLVWDSLSVSEGWRRLYPMLDCLLERRPIGFVDRRAAYPVQYEEPLRSAFPIDETAQPSLKVFLEELKEKFRARTKSVAKVDLPTLGTVAEAQLGSCEACESYIVESRRVDIRQQDAKAAVDEAKAQLDKVEAARREKRLVAEPPDLTDPIEQPRGELYVNLRESGQ